jgi:O-antigen/teichoic acid export membrane protein
MKPFALTNTKAQFGTTYRTGLNYFGATLRLLRRDPDDLGQTRYRRILLTTTTNFCARVVSVSVNLISVPLAANYLGLERYGLWLVASAVVGWIGLTDLGLGNHLTTLLADASGREDRKAARLYATTTLWVLAAIAFVVGLCCAAAFHFIVWQRAYNLKGSLAIQEAPVVSALILFFTLSNLPLQVTQRIYNGYQEGWKISVWQTAGSLSSLLALIWAIRSKTGLVGLALALAGTPVLVMGVNLFYLIVREKPWLFAWPNIIERSRVRLVMSGGFWMFLINVQAILWLGKDNLIIAHLLGPERVGPFNTIFRIYFTLLGLLVSGIGVSMWPAYTEAIARHDWPWVRRAFRRSLLLTLSVYGGICLGVAIVAQSLVRLWAGEALVPTRSLAWALGVEFIILAWTNVCGYLIIAVGKARVIAILGIVGGILSIPLALLFARPLGIAGIPVGSALSCLLLMGLPLHWIATRSLKLGASGGSMKPAQVKN